MGLFDRFTSTKGKDQTAGPKRGVVKATKADKVKDAEKKAFAEVGAAKEPVVAKKAKSEPKTAPVAKGNPASEMIKRALIRAVVTEKSTRGGAQSQYTFEVATTATKADVRQAVHHLYGVMPINVNSITMLGKEVRFGRMMGRTAKRKKMIVTLPAGKTIDVVSV